MYMTHIILLLGSSVLFVGITAYAWRLRTRLFDAEEIIEELEKQNHELTEVAFIDPLTGLLNRRGFLDELEHFIALLHRPNDKRNGQSTHHSIGLFMIDIDYFKSVNDEYGHPAGDLILQAVSSHTKDSLRTTDLVGRWGGEEFIVALPDITESGTKTAAEKLCANIAALHFVLSGNTPPIQVTISIGVVWTNAWAPSSELIEAADVKLYEAKHSGRNKVVMDTYIPPH